MAVSNKKDTDGETKIVDLLKAKGLSVTNPRKVILSLLMKEHGPFSAEEILKKLPKNFCDLATIYRCLNQFESSDLVNVSYISRELAKFEYNDPEQHHHHIICKICKKIDTFHDCLVDKIESALTKKGYKDINHRLEFFGVCETCQN